MTHKPKPNAGLANEPRLVDYRLWLVGAGIMILIAMTSAYIVGLWWAGRLLWRSVAAYW